MRQNYVKAGTLGHAVGDALGVPVEFKSRESLRNNPIKDMTGYGTYNKPKGTWSDDTTMSICLLDSFKGGINYDEIMKRFVAWFKTGEYTPQGDVFDVGNGTQRAIVRYINGSNPLDCGGTSDRDNGNGALMRILPLAYKLKDENFEVIKREVINVASLTHNHLRSHIACVIYVLIAINLINGEKLDKSVYNGVEEGFKLFKGEEELERYSRIKRNDFADTAEENIDSSGYVVSTLESSIWCLLNSESYEETVLKAVNLGDDTDTVAAVTGGLAGIYYGLEAIPKKWIDCLVRKEYLIKLCEEYDKAPV